LLNTRFTYIVLPDWSILIGESTLQYTLYVLLLGIIIYLFVRYQTRSLTGARKLLREKEAAYDEIARQREELEAKNRSITDSLIYASYIQAALLPSESYFKRLLPDSFIFFKPKDIVSGDFYWIRESAGKIYVVAADCTGHGVPGAFMSMIGVELLNKIIIDQGLEDPALILSVLSKGIARTFSGVDEGPKSLKDGIDLGLCVIDRKSSELLYAGAFLPLYILRDNKVIEIKGDRLSVGMTGNVRFTCSRVQVERDDVIYMFSDGYTDQFGGPHDKKFMFRRFRHLLLAIHKFPFVEQESILSDSISSWRGDSEQVDDLMVIGFRPF
jgi:serine phosphatase RsbU (regulator of sigma subunit)